MAVQLNRMSNEPNSEEQPRGPRYWRCCRDHSSRIHPLHIWESFAKPINLEEQQEKNPCCKCDGLALCKGGVEGASQKFKPRRTWSRSSLKSARQSVLSFSFSSCLLLSCLPNSVLPYSFYCLFCPLHPSSLLPSLMYLLFSSHPHYTILLLPYFSWLLSTFLHL